MGKLNLPTRYPANLCDLPADQRHAIEVDRQRWWLAHRIFHGKTKAQVQQWINAISDKDKNQDMARRLNTISDNQKTKSAQITKNMKADLKHRKNRVSP